MEQQEGEPCPVGRSYHDAVCLGYGGDHPQLLVTGGVDKDDNVLSDAWMLDLQSCRWREVRVQHVCYIISLNLTCPSHLHSYCNSCSSRYMCHPFIPLAITIKSNFWVAVSLVRWTLDYPDPFGQGSLVSLPVN